jgi:hypothetical protein
MKIVLDFGHMVREQIVLCSTVNFTRNVTQFIAAIKCCRFTISSAAGVWEECLCHYNGSQNKGAFI